MKRDWRPGRTKVDEEGCCRVCKTPRFDPKWAESTVPERHNPIEAAHVIPRSMGGSPGDVVLPEEIVPLCRRHHREYDEYGLDLLPYLTREEQASAVLRVGMVTAFKIITGDPSPVTPNRGWAA